MNTIFRGVLLATMVALCVPAFAAAQEATTDSLIRRIDLLERRALDLEQRVQDLEALITRAPSLDRQVPASPNWRDISNWRRLLQGMTPDQVRALLGEPERVDAGGLTFWHWNEAHVYFVRGKLEGWSEPRR
jgi:outer membrane protein assembly factor BamE (lipoprotein component of BamABCDE complex)